MAPSSSPRLGLWGARGDRRGLAIQGADFALHMRPSKVMGFDLRSIGWSQLECDWRAFEGLDLTVRKPNGAGPLVAGPWFKDLDVVWGCETFYQDNFPEWAQAQNIATIQHCNPEFYRFERERDLPQPNIVLSPTSWRLQYMPGARVLPCPVNRDLLPYVSRPLTDGLVTYLHVVGLRAAEDRNGTHTLLEALRYVQRPCRVLLRSQSYIVDAGGQKVTSRDFGKVEVVTDIGDRPDYWTLYGGADVLVMPRRYGGQCLPMQEAMSCGLPVIATDVSPQNKWLPEELLIPAKVCGRLRTQAGRVDVFEGSPEALASTMDRLTEDRDEIARLSKRADRWAFSMSWPQLKPRYEAVIKEAAAMR